MAVPLAREALTLTRQAGDRALIASGLLAVGTTVAETDPDRAPRLSPRGLELSTALGYQGALDLVWPPRSHSSWKTGPPHLNSAAVPSAPSNGAVTAS